VTVYVFPTVNPDTTIGDEAPVFVNTAPLDESLATAINEVIAPPPTLDGAVNVTEAWAAPAVAVPIVGALGTCNGKYEAVKKPPKYRFDIARSFRRFLQS
jgi:hypothetical protein